MSLQTADSATVIFLALIFVTGVPGNLLVLKVYFRKARKLSTYVFISFMAISDLILCGATLLHVGFLFAKVAGTKKRLCKIMFYTTVAFIFLSVLTSLVVGLDRYVAVCWPHTKRMSVCTSLILSTICTGFSLIFAIPVLFVASVSSGEYDFVSCKDQFDTYPFLQFAQIIGYTVGMSSIVIIIICYTLVWRAVRKHRVGTNRIQNCPSQKVGRDPVTAASFVTNNQKYASSIAVSTVAMQRVHPHQHHQNIFKIEADVEQGSDNDDKGSKRNKHGNKSDALKDDSLKPISVISNSSAQFGQNSAFHLNVSNASMSFREKNGNLENGHELPDTTFSGNLVDEVAKSSSQVVQSTKGTGPSKATLAVQRKITITLFLIAVISLTTHPIMILARLIPDSILNDIKQTSEICFVLIRVAEFVGFINNAVNPFIYGLFDKRFRNECFKTFSCRWKNFR